MLTPRTHQDVHRTCRRHPSLPPSALLASCHRLAHPRHERPETIPTNATPTTTSIPCLPVHSRLSGSHTLCLARSHRRRRPLSPSLSHTRARRPLSSTHRTHHSSSSRFAVCLLHLASQTLELIKPKKPFTRRNWTRPQLSFHRASHPALALARTRRLLSTPYRIANTHSLVTAARSVDNPHDVHCLRGCALLSVCFNSPTLAAALTSHLPRPPLLLISTAPIRPLRPGQR